MYWKKSDQKKKTVQWDAKDSILSISRSKTTQKNKVRLCAYQIEKDRI